MATFITFRPDPGPISADTVETTLGALIETTPERLVYTVGSPNPEIADNLYVLGAGTPFAGSAAAGFQGTVVSLEAYDDGTIGEDTLLYRVEGFSLSLGDLLTGQLPGGGDAADLAIFSGTDTITPGGDNTEIDGLVLGRTGFVGPPDTVLGGAGEADVLILPGAPADYDVEGAAQDFTLSGTVDERTLSATVQQIEILRFDEVEVSTADFLIPIDARDDAFVVDATLDPPGDVLAEASLLAGNGDGPDTGAAPLSVTALDAAGAPGAETPGTAFVAAVGTITVQANGAIDLVLAEGVADGTTTTFAYTLADGLGRTDTASVTVTVQRDNQPPVVDAPFVFTGEILADTAVPELAVGAAFSDPDGDVLSFSAEGLPEGLAIDPETGTIAGTPAVAGLFAVTVTASDGTASVDTTFDLTVAPAPNLPPVAEGAVLAGEGEAGLAIDPIDAGAAFDDPDGDALSFSAAGLPAGLAIDAASGLVTGTPVEDGTFAVTVTASDGTASASTDFTLTVAPSGGPNAPPEVVAAIAPATAQEDVAIGTIDAGAAFEDADGDALSFTAAGLPAGLAIGTTSGLVTGTPVEDGTFTVTVTASDGTASASTDFTLTIAPAGVPNAPPEVVMTIVPPEGVRTGVPVEPLEASLGFVDPDGDTLSFSATGLPDGLAIDAATGLLAGTPTEEGIFSVVITADDGAATASIDFDLVVTANAPPALNDEPMLPETIVVGAEAVLFDDAPPFVDPDDDALSYAATGLPPGLEIDPATGVIAGVPEEAGTFTITVTADDGFDATSAAFDLVVEPPSLLVTTGEDVSGGDTNEDGVLSPEEAEADGVLSLREAVRLINDQTVAETVIAFAEGVTTVRLSSGLRLERGMTIDGNGTEEGAPVVVVTGDTLDNDPTVVIEGATVTDAFGESDFEFDDNVGTLFEVDAGGDLVTFDGLVLTGGVDGVETGARGGAIDATSDLLIVGSIVTGNRADGFGSEFASTPRGGGIHTLADLTLERSAVAGNLVVSFDNAEGGGVFIGAPAGADAPSVLTLTDSAIDDNVAEVSSEFVSGTGARGGGVFVDIGASIAEGGLAQIAGNTVIGLVASGPDVFENEVVGPFGVLSDTASLDETVTGGTGETFDLGEGTDTVVYDLARNALDVAPHDDGTLGVTGPDFADTLIGVERVETADATLLLGLGEGGEAVAKLYAVGLGRTPDEAGLMFWTDAVAEGFGLDALAQAIVDSPEFAARFGAEDEAATVERFYETALGRASDADGFDFWLGQVESGLTPADLLGHFAASEEYDTLAGAAYDDGVWV